MVFFAFFDQKCGCHEQCQQFRRHDGQPDPVQLQEDRQDHYNRHLEYQCPQKGDQGGNRSVSQSGEEAGTPDIESAQQEGDCVQPEPMAGHGKQLRIISNEYPGHRIGKELRQKHHEHSCAADHDHAFAENIF